MCHCLSFVVSCLWFVCWARFVFFDCLVLFVFGLWLVVGCSLFVGFGACCLLLFRVGGLLNGVVVCCLLFVVCCLSLLLCVVCCIVSIIRCWLLDARVCCLLFGVCCL